MCVSGEDMWSVCVGGGPWEDLHTPIILEYQQGILSLNSILTLPGDSIRFHRLKGLVPQEQPSTTDDNHRPRLSPVTSEGLAENQRFPQPPHCVQLICWNSSQSSLDCRFISNDMTQ